MENIKFCDLTKDYLEVKEALDKKIAEVLSGTKFINGPQVTELEQKIASYVGAKYAIGVSSGTDALLLSLLAKGVEKGDYIITTVFSFFATAEVIALLGAVPVFVDIDEKTYNISPQEIEKFFKNPYHPYIKGKIDLKKIKGIITVDLFGQCCNYDEINSIAQRYGLFVIEDSAQSLGAEYRGRKAGNLAQLGCTSFFPAKPLGAYGDAGMVFTSDSNLAQKIRELKNHGQSARYNHKLIGLNARLDTLQAAVLLAKWDKFVAKDIERRQSVVRKYNEILSPLKELVLPQEASYNKSVWAQYSICLKERDALRDYLTNCGVPTAVHYPLPLCFQEAFSYLNYQKGDFPVAENVCGRILSLPIHPYLDEGQISYIGEKIKEFLNKK